MKTTNIAILGLGLIGGSLGMALKAAQAGIHVTGYARRQETGKRALDMGAVDRMAATPEEAVADAEVVILCTPVLQMLPLASAILPHMKPGTILSEAGSTKKWFSKKIVSLLPPGIHYIGGHPMAGREKSGIESASASLFQERWYIFSPLHATPPALLEKMRGLIALTGARTAVMDEETHDRVTAVISHVPHVAAAALVHLLKKEMNPAEATRFIGGGFRDTTRIASSDADMWADICVTNSDNIAAGIDEMARILTEVSSLIRSGDREKVHSYFDEAKQLRNSLLSQDKIIG